MVVGECRLKRPRGRVTADLYSFSSFPSVGGSPGEPFRKRVRSFLVDHSHLPPPSTAIAHPRPWKTYFRIDDASVDRSSPCPTVCLNTIEEDVSRSRSPFCDECRVVGWSEHPVCRKRYHFIVKADGSAMRGCGDEPHDSETRCKPSNGERILEDDADERMYHQLQETSHLLHGVVHSNGHGHLMRINGKEGGSSILSGCQIMDFWDSLCKNLSVRKVTVMDVSQKYGMEYRLLHAVTRGRPWYGNWGYEFGSGSFGLTVDDYKSAVRSLSDLPVSTLLSRSRDGTARGTNLKKKILFYHSMSRKHAISNVSDLFCFLTSLISLARKSSMEHRRLKPRNPCFGDGRRGMTTGADCSGSGRLSEENLINDLRFLYEAILHPRTMFRNEVEAAKHTEIRSTAQKILDCKHFMKTFRPEKISANPDPHAIRISCVVEATDLTDEDAPNPPPELIVLASDSTVADLKLEAARAFRSVYLFFGKFQADAVQGRNGNGDSELVKHSFGTGGEVRVRGRCVAGKELRRFRAERGEERWTVECACGTIDDDGERMLACDVCDGWQHTRCSGIRDSDPVPAIFLCRRCRRAKNRLFYAQHRQLQTHHPIVT